MVSLGGALGGMFVGFVAPRIFPTYYEFGLGLVVTLLVAIYLMRRMPLLVPLLADRLHRFHRLSRVPLYRFALRKRAPDDAQFLRHAARARIGPAPATTAVRRLMHGVIMHGEQYLKPEKHRRADHLLRPETSGRRAGDQEHSPETPSALA